MASAPEKPADTDTVTGTSGPAGKGREYSPKALVLAVLPPVPSAIATPGIGEPVFESVTVPCSDAENDEAGSGVGVLTGARVAAGPIVERGRLVGRGTITVRTAVPVGGGLEDDEPQPESRQ